MQVMEHVKIGSHDWVQGHMKVKAPSIEPLINRPRVSMVQVVTSYLAVRGRLGHAPKTGAAHLCQGRPIAQGCVNRVHPTPPACP
jgi:hypothetical protein